MTTTFDPAHVSHIPVRLDRARQPVSLMKHPVAAIDVDARREGCDTPDARAGIRQLAGSRRAPGAVFGIVTDRDLRRSSWMWPPASSGRETMTSTLVDAEKVMTWGVSR